MPSYNRAPVLIDTIGYVLAQTFTDFEFLIFDDGSSDESPAVISSFSDPRIKFLGSRRCGPPGPLNELVRAARGEYVIVLHDHDIFAPRLLEKSVSALDRNQTAALVLQGSATVSEDGVSNYREWRLDWPELNDGHAALASILLSKRSVGSPFHACCMIRTSALDSIGRHYEPRYGLHADVDLSFRLLQKYDFCYLPEIVFKFREREVNHFLHSQKKQVLHRLRLIYLKHALECFADDPPALETVIENDRLVHWQLRFRDRIKNAACALGIRK